MYDFVAAEHGEGNSVESGDEIQLHYPLDYVLSTWLQHRIHHAYPEAGGYNDQDAALMEDWNVLNLRYNSVGAAYMRDRKASPDNNFTFNVKPNAPGPGDL